MAEESTLKLHADLAWVLALVWIAKSGRSAEPQPQVHYYLGDRYWRLSERYKARGSVKRAQRLRTRAECPPRLSRGALCGVVMKSYMTILHCLANEIYLELLG
jgi:hypothetical protein